MAYGLKIRNQGGLIQVDNDYSNLVLRSKGTVVCGAQIPRMALWKNELHLAASPYSCLAIHSSNPCCLHSVVDGMSTRTFSVSSTVPGASVEYFLFDLAEHAPSIGSVGLRVRRSDLRGVAFDSRRPYMRVLGAAVGGAPQDFLYGSEKVAWVQGQALLHYEVIPISIGGFAVDALEREALSTVSSLAGGMRVQISEVYGFRWSSPVNRAFPPDLHLAPYNFLAIDVSGM